MKTSRIAFLLSAAVLMAPLSAHALDVKFCVPDCVTDTAPQTFSSQPGQTVTDSTGTVTTTMPLAAFVYQQFTVSATVSSTQSSTLQRITFNPTTITANIGSGCSATAPCKMEVIATSGATDFPLQKPIGGYPAGVYMMGSFSGTQTLNNGDTIAMTGTSSGLVTATDGTVTAFGTDVINTTPAPGAANLPVSLPSACSGIDTCSFMATTLKKAFSTQITETIQLDCGGLPACPTQLVTRMNLQIKTSGNRVSLPLDYITTNFDPTHPEINPTELLTQKLAPQFGDVEVNLLAVHNNMFAVEANVKLANGEAIDPSTEEVFLRVGDYSITILPGNFKKLANGRLYVFTGKIDGREVVASFAKDPRDPKAWVFVAGVKEIQLTGVPQAPLQTQVEIGVGSDIGSDLVVARFFPPK